MKFTIEHAVDFEPREVGKTVAYLDEDHLAQFWIGFLGAFDRAPYVMNDSTEEKIRCAARAFERAEYQGRLLAAERRLENIAEKVLGSRAGETPEQAAIRVASERHALIKMRNEIERNSYYPWNLPGIRDALSKTKHISESNIRVNPAMGSFDNKATTLPSIGNPLTALEEVSRQSIACAKEARRELNRQVRINRLEEIADSMRTALAEAERAGLEPTHIARIREVAEQATREAEEERGRLAQ